MENQNWSPWLFIIWLIRSTSHRLYSSLRSDSSWHPAAGTNFHLYLFIRKFLSVTAKHFGSSLFACVCRTPAVSDCPPTRAWSLSKLLQVTGRSRRTTDSASDHTPRWTVMIMMMMCVNWLTTVVTCQPQPVPAYRTSWLICQSRWHPSPSTLSVNVHTMHANRNCTIWEWKLRQCFNEYKCYSLFGHLCSMKDAM